MLFHPIRQGKILPIALIAFAIVAFIFMVDYSISGGKWPWSADSTPKKVTANNSNVENANTSVNVNTVVNTNATINENASAPVNSNVTVTARPSTSTDVKILSPNGGESYSLNQPVTISYSISQEFQKKITTKTLVELYLVRSDGLIEGYIGAITDFTKTSLVWDPQQLKHWGGLDFTTRAPAPGKYTVLIDARTKTPITTEVSYPVDIFVDGYDRYDGQNVLIVSDGKTIATENLLAQDTSEAAFTMTDPFPGWETYWNGAYGFNFRYPADVTVTESNETAPTVLITQGQTEYRLTITSSVDPIVSNKVSNPECYTETSKKTFNNNTWSVNDYRCGIGATPGSKNYSLISDYSVFEISFSSALSTNLLDQILATLTIAK